MILNAGMVVLKEGPLDPLRQGSPTPGLRTSTSLQPVGNPAAQQEVSGGQVREASSAAPHRSHYHLNIHPRPPFVEKSSSTKPVPGAQKVGNRCSKEIVRNAASQAAPRPTELDILEVGPSSICCNKFSRYSHGFSFGFEKHNARVTSASPGGVEYGDLGKC